AIIVLNALWVVESVAMLVLGWLQPSALGIAFVLVQAAAVAVFAAAEAVGLKRSCALSGPTSASRLARQAS
ncbi:MAG: hypothetical protein ACRCTI_03360, partial [Beijerinckiaceae bacterium]